MSDNSLTSYDQREQLFERAKVGEITGDQADAEAIRLGLGSLSRKPGPDKFRPEAMAHWTLPMAVAWIAYLDLDEVREWYAPYRAECWEWRWQRWRIGFEGPVHEGWHLEERSKPTLSLLGLGAAYDRIDDGRALSRSIAEAREALWIALCEGFFSATGIDTETGRRVEIPSLDWHELVPVHTKREDDEVRRGLLGEGYREVLFPSAPLRGHWRKLQKPTLALPPIMPPTGFGYMPLYCAAQWIATKGGQLTFDPAEVEIWRVAYGELLDAIASEAVKIVGTDGRQTVLVPPHLFVGIAVDYPYADVEIGNILSDELVLRSYPYVDKEHWRGGFDDALVDRGGDRWERLSVQRSDVLKIWPFAQTPQTRSGAPGRPSSAHLYKAELERRARDGEMARSVSAESRYLSDWLERNHPEMPQAKPDAIRASIRSLFWELCRKK